MRHRDGVLRSNGHRGVDPVSAETITLIKQLINDRQGHLTAAVLASSGHLAHAGVIAQRIESLARPLVELKAEGSVSLDIDGYAKVKFSRDATRKADTTAVQESWLELPFEVADVFRFEAGIDTKKLRALSEEHAGIAAQYYKTTIPSEPKMTIEIKVQL